MAEKGIVYRLGWVLYWAACIVAVPSALFGLVALVTSVYGHDLPRSLIWALLLFPFAIVVWLIGRGIRYVLAGD